MNTKKQNSVRVSVLALSELVAGQSLSIKQIAALIGHKKSSSQSTILNMARDGDLEREDGEQRPALFSLPKKSNCQQLSEFLRKVWRPTRIPPEIAHRE